MKIIVFGASGFVGGWICELLKDRGDVELLACLRRWAGASRIARHGINIQQIDLDSITDLPGALRGAVAVINAAVPPSDREPQLAHRLYAACTEAGVRRYIQFSSAALYGERTGDVAEDMPPTPSDDYGRGKAEMEERLRSASVSGGPQLFILRPSIIYGAFSDAWTVRFARRIANGKWRELGWLGEGTCNLVYAGDAARAAIMCATGEFSSGTHVLNINGPDIVSWNEYIERFGDSLGAQDRFVPNSVTLLSTMVGTESMRRGGKWLLRNFERSVRGLTQSGKAGPAIMAGAKSLASTYPALNEIPLLRRKVVYRWNRAETEIGFRPETSLVEGLKHSAQWCHRHGVV